MPLLERQDLARIGLDLEPKAFQQLVADAVRTMPHAGPAGDALHDLTADEVATLEGGGFDLSPERAEDRDDVPLARGAAEYAALLATALTPAQAARRLGIDVSRVRHRLAARTLYGIKAAEGWRLPAFQFDPLSGVLPGLGVVLASLDPGWHPVSVQRWFLGPDPDLAIDGRSVSPRDWLLQGGDPKTLAPPGAIA